VHLSSTIAAPLCQLFHIQTTVKQVHQG